MNKRRLVFATNNSHKLEEARQIIPDGFEIVSLAEIGCHDEIPETSDTLEGNALIKARWVHDKYGCDCFADDTGLMVDALGGAPGVLSARYAGEHCSPADNVAKLLSEMEGKEDRNAHFSTTVALICDGETSCFEGRVEGSIATEPHGSGGFGYDPVFVAEETGKCFAEMTPDEKNAISHRGRALRKLRDFLAICTIIVLIGFSTPSAVASSQWRILSSYDGHTERVIDTPQHTYFLVASQEYDNNFPGLSNLYGVVMRFDKDNDELLSLNSSNYLSDNMVGAIEYNYNKNYLAIGYLNGNLDLLHDDGKVVNIPYITLADSSLKKGINNISFSNSGDEILVATDFGYVIIDSKTAQVKTSRVFNEKINAAAFYDGNIWLACSDALLYGKETAFNLTEFTTFDTGFSHTRQMIPSGDFLMVTNGRHMNLTATKIYKSGSEYSKMVISNWVVSAFKSINGVFVVCRNAMQYLGDNGAWNDVLFPDDINPSLTDMNVGSYDEKNFWFSKGREGFSQRKRTGETPADWIVLKSEFYPNASSAFLCTSIVYHPDYGMIVRNHGYDWIFNDSYNNYYYTDDLISSYRNMEWKHISATYNTDMPGLTFKDPRGIAVDPNNKNHIYCGSHLSGLLRLDTSNPENSIHMSHNKDPFGAAGKPGHAVVTEDIQGDWWRSSYSAPEFDSKGNLWTIYVDNSSPESNSSKYLDLFCLTPAARAATTSASNVQPFVKIRIDDEPVSITPVIKALKYGSHKNMLFIFGNMMTTAESFIIIYDHNGTPEDTSDDRMSRIRNIHDQDGNSYDIDRILAVYEDPLTGLIWFSTLSQLFTLNISDISGDSATARRIKVPRNDGTNLADYLLADVKVVNITGDSKNRKWFSTIGSGLVCTSSDGREIIRTFTPENSGIPSNYVYAACENPENNSMMISTLSGICEYYMSANGESGSNESNVRAYPNPVTPGYAGYVTIDGLPDEAMVKIVDANANIVKECGMSQNGEIKWNITDNNYKRVPGGVYFIIATNGPNSDSFSKVAKVLVIE